jgi:tyrosine-protein phosphatase SIW14
MEKLHMQESTNQGAISRRSTRIFMEEQLTLESGNHLSLYEMRCSSKEEMEKENGQRDMSTSASSDISLVPRVNLGKDLCNIFPITPDAIGKQGTSSLHAITRSSCL